MNLPYNTCDKCSISKKVRCPGLPSRGNIKSDLFIVMDRPFYKDDITGVSFSGDPGQLMYQILNKAGLADSNKYYLTYMVKCYTDVKNVEGKKESLENCPDVFLKQEILKHKPKVVVAVGNDVFHWFTKKTGIIKFRGTVVDCEIDGHKFKLFPTLSPSYLLQNRIESEVLVISDLKRAYSAVNNTFLSWNPEKLSELDYKVVDSIESFRQLWDEVKERKYVAADIECRWLDPFTAKIKEGVYPLVSIQFSTKEKSGWFLPLGHKDFITEDNPRGKRWSREDWKIIDEGLRDILTNPEYFLIGHNFKFDSVWINKWLKIRPRLAFDTMLAHGLFGETSNSLKKLAWEYCVDPDTMCLSKTQGWVYYTQLKEKEEILVFDPNTNKTKWEKLKGLFINNEYLGKIYYIRNNDFNSVTTPQHKWPIIQRMSGKRRINKEYKIIIRQTKELKNIDGAIIRAADCNDLPTTKKYSDSLVRMAGWYFTEGCIKNNGNAIDLSQSFKVNNDKLKILEKDIIEWGAVPSDNIKTGQQGVIRKKGLYVKKYINTNKGITRFTLTGFEIESLKNIVVGKEKIPTMEFLSSCTKEQLQMFIETALLGDGNGTFKKNKNGVIFYQSNYARMNAFVIAATLAGYTTKVRAKCKIVNNKCQNHITKTCNGKRQVCTLFTKKTTEFYKTQLNKLSFSEKDYYGAIWCPITYSGYWVAQRNGSTFITGNSDLGGYEEEQAKYTATLDKEEQYDMGSYPFTSLATYGCCDVDVTYRLFNIFNKHLAKNKDFIRVFEILVNASKAFTDIETQGIKIDTDYLSYLDKELKLDRDNLEQKFKQLFAKEIQEIETELVAKSVDEKGKVDKTKTTEFNIASNEHIRTLFFDKLNIPIDERHVSKKTGDPSVGKPVLNKLKEEHPAADILLKHRTVSKQISSFIEAYPQFIDADHRIHSQYSLVNYYSEESSSVTGTVTGRLSSRNPNLQQVPSRGDGKKIKKLFISDCDDHWLVDCLAPGTRILTANFIWKNIEDLIVGEKLIGFDEKLDKNTKFKTSTVENTMIRNSIRFKITTDKGEVICSDTHMWPSFSITEKPFFDARQNRWYLKQYGKRKWVKTKELLVGNYISFLCPPWTTEQTFEDGWMSGMFDGEGWVSKRGSCGIAQNKGEVLERIKEKLIKDNFSFTEREYNNCVHIELNGPFIPMKIIGKYQVQRLKAKYNYEGMRSWSRNTSPAKILNIERIEDGPVVSLQTSTKTFLAEGFFSHNCDYSGIELRVAAMYSGDPSMKKFFNTGKGDYHRFVASKVLRKKEDQITDSERSSAKTLNFAILYGAGPHKIAEQTGMTIREATKFIDEYFKAFPNLKKWINYQKDFAQQNLYVKSMFGRIRRLPYANSNNDFQREEAMRLAVNSVIQADASDLTLYGLTRIAKYLYNFPHYDSKYPSAIRGSVHDSILLSIHDHDLEEIVKEIKFNILENPDLDFIQKRGILLKCDVSIGKNWGEQDDIEFD